MHEGHRRRLMEKLRRGDNLFEHELLEILLFNAYPRANVNPVAHALLQLYLKCVGECMRLKNNCDSFTVIRNAGEFMQFASVRLGGKTSEHLEFYFLDKACRVRRVYTFTDNDPQKVHVRPEELVKLISVSRPNGIYMAHNHVNNPCEPSEADDDMTKKVQLICSINNVRLYDHCILAPDGIFSYFMSNRLDDIAQDYSVGVFFNGKPVTDKF